MNNFTNYDSVNTADNSASYTYNEVEEEHDVVVKSRPAPRK